MGPPPTLDTRVYPGNASLPPVVVLHGSGQNENSLLGFARSTCPDHTLIAARGRVRWESGYAFFRRLPDRTLDQADLAVGAAAIQNLLSSLGGDSSVAPLILGHSNGAIAAAAAVVNDPSSSSGAILRRPLSPAPDRELPSDLVGYPALLLGGRRDTRRSPSDAAALNRQLQAAGALSTETALDAGHELTVDDAQRVRRWVASRWQTVRPLQHRSLTSFFTRGRPVARSPEASARNDGRFRGWVWELTAHTSIVLRESHNGAPPCQNDASLCQAPGKGSWF